MREKGKARVRLAAKLRREATSPEGILWAHLRDRRLGRLKFRRQHPIGRYVVDFYCAEARLIIEIDGDSHAFHLLAEAERTRILLNRGYQLLRLTNHEVRTNLIEVLESIKAVAASETRSN